VTSAAASATAIAGLIAALLGVLKYFNYKTNRDRMAAVGTAFAEMVKGLNSDDDVQRAANAILLRRFFDPRSEFAVRSLVRRKVPYASDAVNVIAAVLRTERTGIVQKLLADGLAYAPTLANVDLPYTNLRNGYLGEKGKKRPPSMRRVDFFHADLTDASFRGAKLQQAVFYETTCAGTVFEDADLRNADFRRADLRGARLKGCKLAGARFAGATNLPAGVKDRLDETTQVFPAADKKKAFDPPATSAPADSKALTPKVFISAPSISDPSCRAIRELVVDALGAGPDSIVQVQPPYSGSSPLRSVASTIQGCWGVVIIGLPQLHVPEGRLRSGTAAEQVVKDLRLPTPWNQIEAGMAAALGLPMLVISDCASGGVFGLGSDGDELRMIELRDDWDVREIRTAVRDWAEALRPPASA
jgi:hypothetical protein